jgi:hypothetical protein
VHVSASGSFPMVGLLISCVEPLGSAATQLVS